MHIQHVLRAAAMAFLMIGLMLSSHAVSVHDSTLVTLADVVVVPDSAERDSAVHMAATVLVEEVEKRCGIAWPIMEPPLDGQQIIQLSLDDTIAPEGYALRTVTASGTFSIRISGADRRGLLFGVGKFLRMLEWQRGSARFPKNVAITEVPAYPMRGHQLGYRPLSNCYDAWSPEVYDQYIRELALFGTNSIEFIPAFGGVSGPVMKTDYDTMNARHSAICAKYGMAFWVQVGISVDLDDEAQRTRDKERMKKIFAAYPKLDGVFIPGGDPGHNHPRFVLPYLEELADSLEHYHPGTKFWFSLQLFDAEKTDYFYDYVNEHRPDWLGGVISGPGSPSILEERKRLPEHYQFRHYPDITHSTRGQYPVAWWDPALGRTLGRECPNPQPVYYALIHNYFAPYTNGFITYSDGINDDVNKIIWSAMGWDPGTEVRDVLIDYARFFFRPDLAERAADGILALEKNWEGALATNGAVETTLSHWQALAADAPELEGNWRWQLCLIRAHYDAYIRRRVLHERALEREANACLAKAPLVGAEEAMDRALAILNQSVAQPIALDLRQRIEQLGDALFESIGIQMSVDTYHAYGYERGAILDFLDFPMNNRLWLEDEFTNVRAMATEAEKLARLETLRTWEAPGDGSFYDDVGTLDRAPHVVRGEGLNTDPVMERNPNPGFWKWDDGFNRYRLSWLVSMDRPVAMIYETIDPEAAYDIHVTGYRVADVQVNGITIQPYEHNDAIGAIVKYHVPKEAITSGKLTLNWGDPEITEVWLIKNP